MRIETKAKLMYLAETKALIKNALNEKGIAISNSDTFRSYADSIRNTEFQSPDVRYVTFMNGEATLYVKPVATGDDCVDVFKRGIITTTPTKESTVDKVFTYSGWAATDGSVADEGVLKAVKEDKTVYAAYDSQPRQYLITYYDSDGTTVLKTENLDYGSIPSYTPIKDGYDFDGWTTAVSAVTGNASYIAKWNVAAAFSTASWAQIREICDNGTAANSFALGDRRTETITYSDGTTEEVTFEIVDMTADKFANGSAITLIATHALASPYVFNTATGNYAGLYSNSTLEKYLKNDLISCFSEDFRNSLSEKTYKFAGGTSVLTIPTTHGMLDQYWSGGQLLQWGGAKATLFSQGRSIVRTTKDGTNVEYWLANSRDYQNKYYPSTINTSGKGSYSSYANVQKYIVLMLCI